METKKHNPLIRNLVFMNALICGVIGAAMGSSGNILLWLVGGLLAGAFIGWTTEVVLRKFIKPQKLYSHRMLLLVLSEVLLIFYVLIPFYRAFLITHPTRSPVTSTPSDQGMSYEAITLTTSDGVHLAGWYIPSHNGAAIIAIHGSNEGWISLWLNTLRKRSGGEKA